MRVSPEDIERNWKPGRFSDLRYRRFHFAAADAWGVVSYSKVLEFSRGDARPHIAKFLQKQLDGMTLAQVKRWVEANSPIHVPTAGD